MKLTKHATVHKRARYVDALMRQTRPSNTRHWTTNSEGKRLFQPRYTAKQLRMMKHRYGTVSPYQACQWLLGQSDQTKSDWLWFFQQCYKEHVEYGANSHTTKMSVLEFLLDHKPVESPDWDEDVMRAEDAQVQ